MDAKSIISLVCLFIATIQLVLAELGEKEKQTERFMRSIVFLCFVILLDI